MSPDHSNALQPLIAGLPKLSELLKDPAWKVSADVRPTDSPKTDIPYALLGMIFHALSFAETETAYRAWTAAGGKAASIEWEGGPSIDQVLAILMPLENDNALVQGIQGLRLKRFDATTTVLEWNHGSKTVDVRLIRS